MFENELSTIKICGSEYPYKCDMIVLEKIQKTYGDILEFEHSIMGIIPFYDENGIRDETKDTYTIPDIEKVCTLLLWMMEEGVEIAGSELKIPDKKDIMRTTEYSPGDLALEAYKEFSKSFLSKKSGMNTADAEATQKNSTKRK